MRRDTQPGFGEHACSTRPRRERFITTFCALATAAFSLLTATAWGQGLEVNQREGAPSIHHHAIYQLGVESNDLSTAAPLLGEQLEAPALDIYVLGEFELPCVPLSISIAYDDQIKRDWRLTVNSVKDYLALRRAFGEKTASPLLFGSRDVLHISNNTLMVNVTSSEVASLLHFGPYVDSWKSLRNEFNGHYGVQLRMLW